MRRSSALFVLQSGDFKSNQSIRLRGRWQEGDVGLRNDILLPCSCGARRLNARRTCKLPNLTITIQENEFSKEERDFYDSLYMKTRATFDAFVKKGSVLHNYAHIFELLARLRQACDHPYLVIHSKSANVKKDAPDAPKVEAPGRG